LKETTSKEEKRERAMLGHKKSWLVSSQFAPSLDCLQTHASYRCFMRRTREKERQTEFSGTKPYLLEVLRMTVQNLSMPILPEVQSWICPLAKKKEKRRL
jgi:hypothetical protein